MIELRCPSCGRRQAVRQRPRGFTERIAVLFMIRPFVCVGCGRRFRVQLSPVEPVAPDAVPDASPSGTDSTS